MLSFTRLVRVHAYWSLSLGSDMRGRRKYLNLFFHIHVDYVFMYIDNFFYKHHIYHNAE
jgi:hypothetical protein